MRDRLLLWAAMALSYAAAAVTGAWCGWRDYWRQLRGDVAWSWTHEQRAVMVVGLVLLVLWPSYIVRSVWTGARDAVRQTRQTWQESARPVYGLCPDCDRFPYSRCPTCGA